MLLLSDVIILTLLSNVKRSGDDVIFALEHISNIGSSGQTIELYHYSVLSPYLTAMLELSGPQIKVVDIKSNANRSEQNCISDALSVTHLTHVTLTEPSMMLIPRKEYNHSRKTAIISTTSKLDDAVKSIEKQGSLNFEHVALVESNVDLYIRASNGNIIGWYHQAGGILSFDFVYLSRHVIAWSSYIGNDKLVCQERMNNLLITNPCPAEVLNCIKKSIKRYNHWKVKLIHDARELGWLAFDGGLVQTEPNACASFNSIEGATRSSYSKRTILNIDLALSNDGKYSLGMHNSSQVGPIYVNEITSPIQDNIVQNPCLSREFISKWYDDNDYRTYGTNKGISYQTVSSLNDFMQLVYEEDTQIVFDLKERDINSQQRQLQHIIEASRKEMDEHLLENIGVRFFSNNITSSLEILPQPTILKNLRQGRINLYTNAPSRIHCIYLESYLLRTHNISIRGCFVAEGNKRVQERWSEVESQIKIDNSLHTSATSTMKVICDMPASQEPIHRSFWRNGLVKCVEGK